MHSGAETKELDQKQLFQLFLSHMPKQQQENRLSATLPASQSPSSKNDSQMAVETPQQTNATAANPTSTTTVQPERTQTMTFQKKQLLLNSSNATSASLSLSSGDNSGPGSFQNVQSTWGNILTNSVRTTGIKDGSKWRKYGQKVIKNSAFPKNYFKCTVENCPAKKYVEKVIDANGQPAIKTLYVDKHIHEGIIRAAFTLFCVAVLFWIFGFLVSCLFCFVDLIL
jgi:hypothetical protein